ncbi:MAG: hypothetical protein ACOC3X_01615 [Nanoarchaeota archaeon]
MENSNYNHLSNAPDFIKNYSNKQEKIEKILSSRDLIHKEAIYSGISHLRDKDGYINLQNKNKDDVLSKYVDSMIKTYTKHAKEELGVDDSNFALKFYTGKDSGDIKEILKKSHFNFDHIIQLYSQEIHGHTEKTKNDLQKASRHGIKEEHLDEIVNFLDSKTDLKKFINYKVLDYENTLKLLDIYIAKEKLNPEIIGQFYNHIPYFMDPNCTKQNGNASTDYLKNELKEQTNKNDELNEQKIINGILNKQITPEDLVAYADENLDAQKKIDNALKFMHENKTMPSDFNNKLRKILEQKHEKENPTNENLNEELFNKVKELVDKNNLSQDQVIEVLKTNNVASDVGTNILQRLNAEGYFDKNN